MCAVVTQHLGGFCNLNPDGTPTPSNIAHEDALRQGESAEALTMDDYGRPYMVDMLLTQLKYADMTQNRGSWMGWMVALSLALDDL